ncbi:MAG: hypothetical protein V4710_07200 [Verrucomicrobiota bacterium]
MPPTPFPASDLTIVTQPSPVAPGIHSRRSAALTTPGCQLP